MAGRDGAVAHIRGAGVVGCIICQLVVPKYRRWDLCVKPMLNAVIAVPLALFAVYIAYVMIAQWFADRREEKEERKNTNRKGNP